MTSNGAATAAAPACAARSGPAAEAVSDIVAARSIKDMPKVEQPVMDCISDLLTKYTGLREINEDALLYRDLDLNGRDYIDFVYEVEQTYSVDLEEVSPRDLTRPAKDVSVRELKEMILIQMGI